MSVTNDIVINPYNAHFDPVTHRMPKYDIFGRLVI